MPAAALIIVFILVQAIGAAGLWLVLLAGARLLRARALTWQRSLAVIAIWCVVGLVCGLLDLTGAPMPVQAACAIGAIAGSVVLLKRASLVGWGRAAAMAALLLGGGLVWAFILIAAVNATLFKTHVMTTSPMDPAIAAGDRIIADRTATPQRWSIIVFSPPHDPANRFIFRLVGLPGETVEIVDGQVLINGTPAPKPPDLAGITYDGEMELRDVCRGGTGHPITLGSGEYYVLGDNATMAFDSRFWPPSASGSSQPGAIREEDIYGVVRAVYFPLSRARWFR